MTHLKNSKGDEFIILQEKVDAAQGYQRGILHEAEQVSKRIDELSAVFGTDTIRFRLAITPQEIKTIKKQLPPLRKYLDVLIGRLVSFGLIMQTRSVKAERAQKRNDYG